MSAPFIGEIRAFGFNFAPKTWAMCNGQLLQISQNAALFSLLGTQYGGNGVQTFGLPDLRGRAAMNQGQGPGLSNYVIGEQIGTETVTLVSTEMPQHNHLWAANNAAGDTAAPINNFLAGAIVPTNNVPVPTYAAPGGATVPLAAAMLGLTGNNQPHQNMQPYLVVTYCIALSGIFPSRN
jgi:microcystin-dependent protein